MVKAKPNHGGYMQMLDKAIPEGVISNVVHIPPSATTLL